MFMGLLGIKYVYRGSIKCTYLCLVAMSISVIAGAVSNAGRMESGAYGER